MTPDPVPPAMDRGRSRWRPLVCFWLGVLTVATVGGAALERLGPIADRSRTGSQRSANPGESEPSLSGPPHLAAAQSGRPDVTRPVGRVPSSVQTIEPAHPSVPSPPRIALEEKEVPPSPATQGSADAGAKDSQPDDRVLVTLHPARPADGKALAQQLASRAGLAPDQIDIGEAGNPGSHAMIRFYSLGDHPLARRIGLVLTQLGYAWQIENNAGRPAPPGHQVLDVWLPQR
jgi:hypothetical protein